MSDNALGDFLRARRCRVRPEEAGVSAYGVRRVPGLRREEVAVSAGMNVDYYTRLEQGRERHPSPQVLSALGRALRLDDEARAHLFRLGGAVPSDRCVPRRDTVSPELRQLMDGYAHTPAFVLNRALDVLAANALAEALFSPFSPADNLARMVFLDPAAQRFYRRPQWIAETTVANLREAAGCDPTHPRLKELVDFLSARSPEFTELWQAHSVRGKSREAKELDHPDVGALTLTYQAFDVRDAPGQQLVIYHAEPGTASAQALALLGTVGATRRSAGPAPLP